MSRSANFTVRLSALGSAAATTQSPRPRKPKIAVAIGPGRPVEVVEVFTMVSSWFARTPCRDHAAPETCGYGIVVNGLEARAKGRFGKSPAISLAHSRRRGREGGLAPDSADSRRFMQPGPADLLREGAATVRYGFRTARHRVLPGEPTGDTLPGPWTPHQMPCHGRPHHGVIGFASSGGGVSIQLYSFVPALWSCTFPGLD